MHWRLSIIRGRAITSVSFSWSHRPILSLICSGLSPFPPVSSRRRLFYSTFPSTSTRPMAHGSVHDGRNNIARRVFNKQGFPPWYPSTKNGAASQGNWKVLQRYPCMPPFVCSISNGRTIWACPRFDTVNDNDSFTNSNDETEPISNSSTLPFPKGCSLVARRS